ncbi:helix-turn-helix transcriptional regulator [Vibrio intestinalis]|uniref:helix-turn-helix transcriptional regulator n=1 Tax=Vibrio intestinalis TaxID=2933291 RepID=UPI0021A8B4E2|nr:AraC family transcriptional regulator [Vibrio intestinalis]
MDLLANTIDQHPHLQGQCDQLDLNGQCRVQIINCKATDQVVLNDPVTEGCYISVMGRNDAHSLSYPEYPSASLQQLFIATLIPDQRIEDRFVVPKGGFLQAIRIFFPFNDRLGRSLIAQPNTEQLKPIGSFAQGWQMPLSGQLLSVVSSIWQCTIQGEARTLWLHGKMFEILALAMTQQPRLTLSQRACELVERSPEKNWTINSLSRQLATNDCYLKRAFKQELGVGVAKWIQNYRMEIAQKNLKTTQMSITEIALSLGYQSNSYFTKVFRQHLGVTPAQFRGKNSRM